MIISLQRLCKNKEFFKIFSLTYRGEKKKKKKKKKKK